METKQASRQIADGGKKLCWKIVYLMAHVGLPGNRVLNSTPTGFETEQSYF